MTMIKVLSGEERSVYDYLQKKDEVRDIYRLFGEYDFFLVLQAGSRIGANQFLSQINEKQAVVKTAEVLFTVDSNNEIISELDYTGALAQQGGA